MLLAAKEERRNAVGRLLSSRLLLRLTVRMVATGRVVEDIEEREEEAHVKLRLRDHLAVARWSRRD